MVPTHSIRTQREEYLKSITHALLFLVIAILALELIAVLSHHPVGIFKILVLIATAAVFTGFNIRHQSLQQIILSGPMLSYLEGGEARTIERCDICYARISLASKARAAAETRVQILAKNPNTPPIYIPARLFFRAEVLRWVRGVPMDQDLRDRINALTGIRPTSANKAPLPF